VARNLYLELPFIGVPRRVVLRTLGPTRKCARGDTTRREEIAFTVVREGTLEHVDGEAAGFRVVVRVVVINEGRGRARVRTGASGKGELDERRREGGQGETTRFGRGDRTIPGKGGGETVHLLLALGLGRHAGTGGRVVVRERRGLRGLPDFEPNARTAGNEIPRRGVERRAARAGPGGAVGVDDWILNGQVSCTRREEERGKAGDAGDVSASHGICLYLPLVSPWSSRPAGLVVGEGDSSPPELPLRSGKGARLPAPGFLGTSACSPATIWVSGRGGTPTRCWKPAGRYKTNDVCLLSSHVSYHDSSMVWLRMESASMLRLCQNQSRPRHASERY